MTLNSKLNASSNIINHLLDKPVHRAPDNRSHTVLVRYSEKKLNLSLLLMTINACTVILHVALIVLNPNALVIISGFVWTLACICYGIAYFSGRDAIPVRIVDNMLICQHVFSNEKISFDDISDIAQDHTRIIILGKGGRLLKEFKINDYDNIAIIREEFTHRQSINHSSH